MLKIARTTIDNNEMITITINKHFEAKELYYLKEYRVKGLVVDLLDLDRGQIALKATVTINNK
jgi:hypothetical protein